MTRGTYHRFNKQTTTEEVRSLDIRHIYKKRFINDDWIDSYTWSDGESCEYRKKTDRLLLTSNGQTVFLDKTRCHYGGFRYWFKCPRCTKRSAVLYNRDSVFLCRQCHKLPYLSQRESEIDRLICKLRKIRKKVNASSNLSVPIVFKPKSMHWKTFDHLLDQERDISQKYAYVAAVECGWFW